MLKTLDFLLAKISTYTVTIVVISGSRVLQCLMIKLDKQEAHWLHCSPSKQENCIYGHLRRADTYDYYVVLGYNSVPDTHHSPDEYR